MHLKTQRVTLRFLDYLDLKKCFAFFITRPINDQKRELQLKTIDPKVVNRS